MLTFDPESWTLGLQLTAKVFVQYMKMLMSRYAGCRSIRVCISERRCCCALFENAVVVCLHLYFQRNATNDLVR